MGIYHIGAAAALETSGLLKDCLYTGASAGALAATSLASGRSSVLLRKDFQKIIHELRAQPLGMFTPGFKLDRVLKEVLEESLPKDAHVSVSGKLYISITRTSLPLKGQLVSSYSSREELIRCAVASSYIPGITGAIIPSPEIRGLIDGGLSMNWPVLSGPSVAQSPLALSVDSLTSVPR